MDHAFTWVSVVPGLNLLPEQTATAALVAVALLVWSWVARRQIATVSDAVVPDGTLTARNALEIYVEGFNHLMIEPVLGPQGRKYAPFYSALFLFILANNLAGLIPGFAPATSNVNTNLALGLISFAVYNYYGFREHGAGYLKHFLGPILWLAPLLVVLEIIDQFIRPVTLTLRLLMNMFADHLVLEIFTDLSGLVVPVLFLMLGAFVSVIQAYVFTLLSLVYVSMAVARHGGEEHGGH